MGRITRRRRAGGRREEGVTIVLVALLLTALFTMAALGVDISSQVNQRQELRDTIDVAAHAGAYELPGTGQGAYDATQAAIANSMAANDPTFDLSKLETDYFCVVASERVGLSDNYQPADRTIPSVCDPRSKKVSQGIGDRRYHGMVCNQQMCAIPCDLTAGDKCNTVKVRGDKVVDYQFAPVIGDDDGTTGVLTAAACKGPCAQSQGTPLDIVFVVDRTVSMKTEGECLAYWWIFCVKWAPEENHIEYVRDALNGTVLTNGQILTTGIFDLLEPDVHRVALATIHKSTEMNRCTASASADSGVWVPVRLTNSFAPLSTIRNVVSCLPQNPSTFGYVTDLTEPLDHSAAELRSAGPRAGVTPRKAIILLTDGAPNLPRTDPCASAIGAANRAKANNDIIVITIAYRLDSTHKCTESSYNNVPATDLLSDMASRTEPTAAAAAVNHCKSGNYATENADGDYFFCAPDSEDLQPVLEAAVGAANAGSSITIVKLPV